MQKQIKDFTDIELKAIAYDLIAEMEKIQNNLKVVNNELNSRMQNAQKETNMPGDEIKTEATPETPATEAEKTEE